MGCACIHVPSERGPPLPNNFTSLKYTSLKHASLGLAKQYRDLGERYHQLPLHIRDHEVVPEWWKEHCKTTFVVSANRELPDLIQVFSMLESKFKEILAAVFKNKVDDARRELRVAGKLAEEANERMLKLHYAVLQYEWLANILVGEVDEVNPAGGVQKAAMEEAWEIALPTYCDAS